LFNGEWRFMGWAGVETFGGSQSRRLFGRVATSSKYTLGAAPIILCVTGSNGPASALSAIPDATHSNAQPGFA